MKRKLKKLLRLFLVFLSCFAFVCLCLPAKATAQDFTFSGNSSTSMDLKANAYNYFIDKLKDLYDSMGTTEDWANFCEEHGVDILTQTINYNNNFVLDVMASELSAATGIPEPFLHLSTELSNIDNIYQNTSDYSARGKKNYDDFSQFYKYANMRGSTSSIDGDSFSSSEWDIPYQVNFRFECLYHYRDYPDQPSYWWNCGGFTVDATGTALGATDQPWFVVDYSYNNGQLNFNYIKTADGAIISDDTYRVTCTFYTNSWGNDNRIIRVVSNAFSGTPLIPINDCDVENGNTIRIKNMSDNNYSFYCHTLNSGVINFYWGDYVFGGITAPVTPVYQFPIKENNPYYEREVQEYNYYTTLTQQILDDYDVSQLYNDLYNSFEGSSWLTFPLEVWRDFGNLMLDGYSNTFHFHIDRIDLDFIEFGFNFPECDYEFDPYDYIGGSSDLQNAMGVLFVTFQHIIAFGYIYALIVWGRSLILRIGSDTIHRDYEDN